MYLDLLKLLSEMFHFVCRGLPHLLTFKISDIVIMFFFKVLTVYKFILEYLQMK